MSEVILYEGLVFTLPEQPKHKDISGYKLPKEQQKWKRNDTPEKWEILTEEEQFAFATEEDRRCTEGYWFYNNGIATFITGDHYFYLNWFKIDSGYPDYRDRDKRWFYHWFLCDNDDNCIGQNYGKLRRDGYSYRMDSVILNRARKTFDSHYGIVSKTGEDAKEMFAKLVHGFLALPNFFKPQVQSQEDVKKQLIFKTPPQKVTFKTRVTVKEISLNTTIDFKNTKENAYDGFKCKVIAADEVGKWDEVNAEKWLNIAKTCVTLGRKIIGKIGFGSTVNESNKGGVAFKAVWEKSSILDEKVNGRTGSGLWRYFVPAYDGIEGFIDEYGMSVIDTPENPVMGIDGIMITEGAKPYYEAERKAKLKSGDVVGYYEELRQRPFTEDDMFREAANDKTAFDLEKIYQQIENNEITSVDKFLRRGQFQWVGGVRDSKVEWIDTPQGLWQMYWMPKFEDRNKKTMLYGKVAPANTHIGCFSLDPYAAKQTKSKKNSKAASHGFRKYDMLEPDMPAHFVTQYWGRPSDPLIVYEQMIMQCVFYGWKILIENNKSGCLDYFRNRGYANYMMNAPALTEVEYNKRKPDSEADVGLANNGEAKRQQMIEFQQNYIVTNVGRNNETGKMGFMPFDDTLKDWAAFDADKWTDYDLTVSTMLCIVGSNDFVKPKRKVAPGGFFPQYQIRGNVSKLIKS